MESITNFLDPKSIPDVTGDELDVDKELNKKSDLETDSDTVEVNITNNIQKDAPAKASVKKETPKLSDIVLPGKKESDEEEESSESDTDSTEQDQSTETETEPTEQETSTEEPQEEEASKEQPADESVVKEEESKEEETTESGEEESDFTGESGEESGDEDNPEVDHGENDLEVDQQEAPPLLKLESENDFHSIKTYLLPNGANVVYVNNPSELCLCAFDFKVGSYYEDDSNRGISHLLEHLMFNGCPGISALEFNEKLDRMGMHVNAFTDRMNTVFHFSGLKENFIPAFELYNNLIKSFTPTQETLDKEKGVVINEIGVYNDKNWTVLNEAVASQAFRQHPIAYPILGFEDVIRNISVDQVKDWYGNNYNANNLTVYLIGDFPEEDLVFVADKLQAFDPGNKNSDPVITDAMVIPSYRNVIAHKDGITQTLIDGQLIFKNEAFNVYELAILSEVLGGSMSSYLWNEFREERSIAYQVGSYDGNMDPEHLCIHLYAGLNEASDAEVAKGIFKDALAYAKAITEEDFNKGLNITLTGLLNEEETSEGLLDLVRECAFVNIDVDTYVTAFKNLTYDSYQAFAQQIVPENIVTGILYPLEV